MRPRPLVVIFLLVLTCLAVVANSAGAITDKYVEDFTTKQYCDRVNTTALWDTVAGELKLPPFQPTLVGSCETPDWACGVAISGDYAYVGISYEGFLIFDIANPANPTLVGSCDTPGDASGIAIAGHCAYVSDWDYGIQVIDITDASSPTIVGSCDTPVGAQSVIVDGDFAYVGDRQGGLQVIDISDPTTPTLVGGYNTPGGALEVAISGDYAYVADWTSIQVIDISDPTSPTFVTSYATSGHPWNIAISGDCAYVADWEGGLQVIDISDPANPSPVGSYSAISEARSVEVNGDYAYVSDYETGLKVINIADPANPNLAGTYDMAGCTQDITVSGDYAYAANQSGLQVIRIADPVLPPARLGQYDTPGFARGATVSGQYAYVADGEPDLQVVNISDPIWPSYVGSYDTPGNGYGRDVAVSGDYAYVADFSSGLQVIDISDPATPSFAGSYDTPGMAERIAISGDYAYVADANFGLQVIDISDPAAPSYAGSYDTPDYAEGVAISGDYAYVADGSSGLQVIDISDPATPSYAGSYDTPGLARSVVISGDCAYVADGPCGLQVIDISDSATPSYVASYDTPGEAYNVTISGDYAYVADIDSGLQVIDISDPAAPLYAGSYDTPGLAMSVVISGDYACVGDGYDGLQMLQVYERSLDISCNKAQSLVINSFEENVDRVKLSAGGGGVWIWEASADGGHSWKIMLRDGEWNKVALSGNSLLWRTTIVYEPLLDDPVTTELSIEWLYDVAIIDSIVDVPGDQGGWVRLYFARSGKDFADETDYPISTYYIWRRIDDPLMVQAIGDAARGGAAMKGTDVLSGEAGLAAGPDGFELVGWGGRHFLSSSASSLSSGFPPGTWEIVGSAPGAQQDSYVHLTATLADSSNGGVPYSVYLVTAHTTTPSIWYVSPPDSGYSVDNLAPAPPGNLMMTSPTTLAWDESKDKDFKHFTVYGSALPGVDSTATLIGYTIGTAMDVTGDAYEYYHVTASDFSGNEGDAASVENAYSGVRHPDAIPAVFALKPNQPNPFAVRTSIVFDLPVSGAVSLKVFDAQGRRVKTLADQAYPAGRHSVVWAGDDEAGNAVGSGIYFARMEAGDFRATSKMLLTR